MAIDSEGDASDRLISYEATDATIVDELSISPAAVAVTLRSSTSLRSLQGIEKLTGIRTLDIGYCPEIDDISPLTNLPKLEALDVSRCTGVTDWTPLREIPSLRVLTMEGMPDDRALQSIASISQLTELNLSCSSFDSIASLAPLTHVNRLKLESCRELSDISALAAMSSLRSVDIGFCYELRDVSPLGHIKPEHIETTTDALSVNEDEDMEPDERLSIWYETWTALNLISMPAPAERIQSAERALNIVWPFSLSLQGSLHLFATPEYIYVRSRSENAFQLIPIDGNRGEFVADAIWTWFKETSESIEISISSNDFLGVLRNAPIAIKNRIRSITVSLWPEDLSRLSDSLTGSSIDYLILKNLGSVRVIHGIYGVIIDTIVLENCPVLEDIDGYPPISISEIQVSRCPKMSSVSLAQCSLIETRVKDQAGK